MKPFFLFLLALLLVSNLYSQCAYQTNVPKEFYRNRYQPADAVTTRPFTLFNKTKPNWNLETDLALIKSNIKKQIGSDGKAFAFALLYKQIYEEAIKSEPSKCAIDQEECPHPIWVKIMR